MEFFQGWDWLEPANTVAPSKMLLRVNELITLFGCKTMGRLTEVGKECLGFSKQDTTLFRSLLIVLHWFLS